MLRQTLRKYFVRTDTIKGTDGMSETTLILSVTLFFPVPMSISRQACPDSVGRQILYFTARIRVRKTTMPQAI